MFRKFVAVVAALMLVVGGLFAEDLKGIFKKYEDGKVTIEVDGKDQSFKVSPDAKFKTKKGKEVMLTDAFKFVKEGTKGTFTVEDGMVTKIAPDRKKKAE